MSKTADRTLPTEGQRAPTEGRPTVVFLVAYHRDGAKAMPLVPGGSVVVGRTYPADLVVEDRSLSRQHARFHFGPDGISVEDLGSTNGTLLHGMRLTRALLRADDQVRLGDVAVSLHAPGASGGEPHRIDGHDRFVAALDESLASARATRRPVVLAMVRAAGAGDLAASRWAPAVLAQLRPADRAALYGPDALLLCWPEGPREQAERALSAVTGADPRLRAAVVSFPADGGTADELLASVRGALATATTERPVVSRGDGPASVAPPAGGVVVHSAVMRELYETIARVAPSLLPVLVMGETGSGKELVARALHEGSPRRAQPLRSVNCGAIPATLLEGTLFGHERGAFTGAERTSKGLFEQAQGGTVFLDEVGELSAQAQAALLRVLETRRITRLGGDREIDVDVRVVAATHRDLEQLCEAGTFRWDLLYRLNAMTLRVPPLRERPEDLGPLVEAFVAEANRTHGRAVRGIEPGAWECVTRHRWPGNVRELRNAVDRAVVIARGERITEEDLPERVRAGAASASAARASAPAGATAVGSAAVGSGAVGSGAGVGAGEEEGLEYRERLKQHMQRYETELIVEALRKFNGNQTEAARALQMPLRTLAHKIQTYGIKKTFGPK